MKLLSVRDNYKINKKLKYMIILSYILIILNPKLAKAEVRNNYDNIDASDFLYSSYSLGNIYIGKEGDLEQFNPSKQDIVVYDYREYSNPNMKVRDSYKITDGDMMDEIINVLLEYESEFPSNWSRTAESMKREWILHNIAYSLSVLKNKSASVDFDNMDEDYIHIIKNRNYK